MSQEYYGYLQITTSLIALDTPRWIILHGTAGFTSAQEVGYYFQQADVATHYIIGYCLSVSRIRPSQSTLISFSFSLTRAIPAFAI